MELKLLGSSRTTFSASTYILLLPGSKARLSEGILPTMAFATEFKRYESDRPDGIEEWCASHPNEVSIPLLAH
jgi:hypothetical protein